MSENIDIKSLIREARKTPEEVAALVAPRREEVTIPIMKPLKKGIYWHVRAGDEWDYVRNALLLLPSDRDAGRSDFMLIHPDLTGFVESKEQIKSVARTFGLALAVNALGAPAFWALNLNDTSSWGTSARQIAGKLKTSWGMVISDSGRYVVVIPEGELAPPKWPEGNPDDLLGIAFKDRVITSENHPEFLKLLGKI